MINNKDNQNQPAQILKGLELLKGVNLWTSIIESLLAEFTNWNPNRDISALYLTNKENSHRVTDYIVNKVINANNITARILWIYRATQHLPQKEFSGALREKSRILNHSASVTEHPVTIPQHNSESIEAECERIQLDRLLNPTVFSKLPRKIIHSFSSSTIPLNAVASAWSQKASTEKDQLTYSLALSFLYETPISLAQTAVHKMIECMGHFSGDYIQSYITYMRSQLNEMLMVLLTKTPKTYQKISERKKFELLRESMGLDLSLNAYVKIAIHMMEFHALFPDKEQPMITQTDKIFTEEHAQKIKEFTTHGNGTWIDITQDSLWDEVYLPLQQRALDTIESENMTGAADKRSAYATICWLLVAVGCEDENRFYSLNSKLYLRTLRKNASVIIANASDEIERFKEKLNEYKRDIKCKLLCKDAFCKEWLHSSTLVVLALFGLGLCFVYPVIRMVMLGIEVSTTSVSISRDKFYKEFLTNETLIVIIVMTVLVAIGVARTLYLANRIHCRYKELEKILNNISFATASVTINFSINGDLPLDVVDDTIRNPVYSDLRTPLLAAQRNKSGTNPPVDISTLRSINGP